MLRTTALDMIHSPASFFAASSRVKSVEMNCFCFSLSAAAMRAPMVSSRLSNYLMSYCLVISSSLSLRLLPFTESKTR